MEPSVVPSGLPTKSPRRARRKLAEKLPSNVFLLHQRIMPRHTALLARWLDAGRRMGLCDASAFLPNRIGTVALQPGQTDYVLVWVRENIDPAYMILPEGATWLVVDAVREQHLARVGTFAAALNFIRPVLPLEVAA